MLDHEDIKMLKEVFSTKEELIGFKNEILDGQDEIIDKLGTLLQEKIIGDEQDKRQKKVLEIHNNALKRGKILSGNEISQIDQLGAF